MPRRLSKPKMMRLAKFEGSSMLTSKREERNDATGDDAIRADGDLESEVRSN